MTTTVGTPLGVTASSYKTPGPTVPLTGLGAWYDAADAASFVYGTGAAVSQWKSRSGIGPILYGSAPAVPSRNGSQNGLTTVVFSAPNGDSLFTYTNFMPTMVADNFALYVACHQTATVANNTAIPFQIGSGAANGYGMALQSSNPNVGFLRGGIAWHSSGFSHALAPGVFSLRRNAGLWKLHRDGTELVLGGAPVTAAPNMPTNYVYMPSSQHLLTGAVFEVLFYQVAHTDVERQNIESYLKSKWGLAWTPADLPNLRCWYDAADSASFTYSSGTVVSQWNDRSSNAKHAVQGTVANQPNRNVTQNGLPCVAFDGSNDGLLASAVFPQGTWNAANPHTLLVVAKIVGSPSGQRSPIGSASARPFRTGTGTIAAYGGLAVKDTGIAWTNTTVRNVVTRFNGNTTSGVSVDGGAFATGTDIGPSATTGLYIGQYGSGENWMGNICEVVAMSSMISDADVAKFKSYCSSKWGTA